MTRSASTELQICTRFPALSGFRKSVPSLAVVVNPLHVIEARKRQRDHLSRRRVVVLEAAATPGAHKLVSFDRPHSLELRVAHPETRSVDTDVMFDLNVRRVKAADRWQLWRRVGVVGVRPGSCRLPAERLARGARIEVTGTTQDHPEMPVDRRGQGLADSRGDIIDVNESIQLCEPPVHYPQVGVIENHHRDPRASA